MFLGVAMAKLWAVSVLAQSSVYHRGADMYGNTMCRAQPKLSPKSPPQYVRSGSFVHTSLMHHSQCNMSTSWTCWAFWFRRAGPRLPWWIFVLRQLPGLFGKMQVSIGVAPYRFEGASRSTALRLFRARCLAAAFGPGARLSIRNWTGGKVFN